jgi:hypothetical protein
LDDFFELEENLLTSLAQKYKVYQEEQDIPKCQNCNFRRQQLTTFPADRKGWCQECIEQEKKNNQNPEKNPVPLPTPPNNELNQTKQELQNKYNLNLEEFNLVLEPLTDWEVLEAVDKLISKVKTGTEGTDSASLYESLVTYQEAPDGSLKKQVYLAVNAYQQQVDQLIDSLEVQLKKCKSSLQELVAVKDETELNRTYQLIKEDSELYQSQNQSLIDNHQKRVKSSLQITSQDQVSEIAQELATALRTIIASDSDKDDLISLEQKIKEWQTATEGEKFSLYQQYSSIIDQMEQEIKTELTRRNKSEDEPRDNPTSPTTTPQPTREKGLALFLTGLGAIFTLLTLTYLY